MKRQLNFRALCLYTFLLIIAPCCQAQNYSYGTRFTLSARNFVDSIPIEFIDNQIYIKAYTANREWRFCLDTGSSQGILYTDSKLPRHRLLGKIMSHDANGVANKVDVVEFPDFRIGHLVIHGYAGTLLNSHVAHTDYDAVLGFDLVNKGLTMKLDVAQKVMVLTDIAGFFDNEGGYAVKYRLPRWVPIIQVSPYAGCTDEVRFDTGSRRLYVMSNESRRKFTALYPDFSTQVEGTSYGRRAIGSFGTERSDEVAFLWLDGLQWGDFAFLDYHTMTTQGHSRIGAEILRYGSVIMNPKRKQLIFQPYGDNESCMVSNSQMDIAFIPDRGRPTVGMIWEGSRHYKSGFRQGDRILSIDGHGIVSFQQFLSYPFIQGHVHEFTVLGIDGIVRTIESER